MRVELGAVLETLALMPIGKAEYHVANLDVAGPVVFGGQILAQSVVAGLAGHEGKSVKTVHTVFARAGAVNKPMVITVERVHSGRSFASSMVTFSQDGKACSRSMVLLSADEPDVIRHADGCSPVPPPAPDDEQGRVWRTVVAGDVDVRDPDHVGSPDLEVWSCWVDAPDDPATNQALLAFSTESFLIGTAMLPHPGVGQAQAHRTLSTGVISHTITFHQPCAADEWVLLRQHSSFAGGGRAFGRGDAFTAKGQLVASFVQDSMIKKMSAGRADAL